MCGHPFFSVSHWTISGDLRNCALHNHGVRCGPKGHSLPLPRTEARLTRAENDRSDGCQKEIPGRRPCSLAGSSQIGVSAERSGPMRQCQNAPMVVVYLRVCGGTRRLKPYGHAMSGLSPRVRRYRPPVGPLRHPTRSISACAEVHCDTLSGRAIDRQVRGRPVWRNAIATGLVAGQLHVESFVEQRRLRCLWS